MTVDGGGWISMAHLTKLDKLNYSIPHGEVGLSEGERFWLMGKKASGIYSVKPYNNVAFTNYEVEAASPAATGWLWGGLDYPNPPGCHVFQQFVLVQSPDMPPRSYGNPHFNQGAQNPAGLVGTALATKSTIGVAAVANYPSIHIGCIGWNVLKDPIVWIR